MLVKVLVMMNHNDGDHNNMFSGVSCMVIDRFKYVNAISWLPYLAPVTA